MRECVCCAWGHRPFDEVRRLRVSEGRQMSLKSVTVEYQRFGDSVGMLRLSDRYIRTIGITDPADDVPFGIDQDKLARAMALLDYGRFSSGGEDARERAERVLAGLAPVVEEFLCAKALLHDGANDDVQID